MLRLNLGAGRLDTFVSGRAAAKLKLFIENCDSWVHLGEDVSKLGKDDFYGGFDYRAWFYKRGDPLPFDDGEVDFICSEHFFEHLLLADAAILMEECARVLRPGGVIRVACPDLFWMHRPTEIHSVGSSPSKPIDHPDVHKVRWSVYSLGEALFSVRLVPIPVRYWDRYGKLYEIPLEEAYRDYDGVVDEQSVLSLDCLNRLVDSVIIDGLKREL